ncbi:MAG: multiheme c-type cytochrome [Planctomycetota bacterium]
MARRQSNMFRIVLEPRWLITAALTLLLLCLPAGCPPTTQSNGENGSLVFNNTTDATNGGAEYIGSAACKACHPDVAAIHRIHAHNHALTPIQGRAPEYAPEGTRASVPNPPAGLSWNNISYVIAGYLHGAFFVDQDGFVATDGVIGTNTLWNLDFPSNGTHAGFAAYLPDQVTPKPYDYEMCFRCHTTGPRPQDPDDPRSQDGRPGILGTWAEPGVQCEACHGPGSTHAPNPTIRGIFVDSTPQTCGRCHTSGDDPDVIVAADGFLGSNTQYPQLLASGGHGEFNCTVCHNPHASTMYDRDRGLRNDCTACHVDMNLAFHDGFVYQLGDYVETVNCQSCHMPLAGLSTSFAPAALVGPEARIGDVRAHIFRIDTTGADSSAFFTPSGSAVRKDAQGRAALTADFVCLRCHNNAGVLFPLTIPGAGMIADNIHQKAADAH